MTAEKPVRCPAKFAALMGVAAALPSTRLGNTPELRAYSSRSLKMAAAIRSAV